MGILAMAADERVADVKFTRDAVSVDLRDGRTITVPLAWYPACSMPPRPSGRTGAWRVAATASIVRTSMRLSTEGLLRGGREVVLDGKGQAL
jgi:Protein of unknown function (DUF2442)